MAQRHLLRPNPQRPRPPTRPAIRPLMEIDRGLAIQNSELAERDVELGENIISANCEL